MAKIKKLNPETGQKEWVDTSGTIERSGGSAADQFSGNFSYIKDEKTGSFTPKPVASEVSVLSTESARNTLKTAMNDQNQDQARITNSREQAKLNAGTTADARNNSSVKGYTLEEAKTLGIDLNSATFDQKTGTFYPTTQPVLTDEQKREQELSSSYDADLKEIDNTFDSYSDMLDDEEQQIVSSIRGIYRQIADEQRDANKRQLASFQNFGIREGGSRYAGEVQQGILNAEERAGLARIQEIAVKEASEIAAAKKASAEKKWEYFMKKRDEIKTLRDKRQEEINKLRDAALERKKKSDDAKIKASRDNAIANLISQGVTDPKKILNFLNYDESGNETGDFTIKEVSDAVKMLIPKPAGSGAGNKITLSEARSQGLPLSVVGMSEVEIAASFDSENVPSWFREKAESEGQASLRDETLSRLWGQYRDVYLNNKKGSFTREGEYGTGRLNYGEQKKPMAYETTAENNKARAIDYFKSAYGDAVDEETLNTLAEYVVMYTNSGMSYEEAVDEVVKQATE